MPSKKNLVRGGGWLLLARVACFGLLGLAGCSDGLPKLDTAPASGTVTYKGQPVVGAQVTFINTDKQSGKNATALTDNQGRFTLRTYVAGAKQVTGAMPGDYIVTIEKREVSSYSAGPPSAETQTMLSGDPKTSSKESMMKPGSGLSTPAKYADPAKGELRETVKSTGDNNFTFDLVDD